MKRMTEMLQPRFALVLFLLLAHLVGATFVVQSAPPEQGLLPGSTNQKLTKVSHGLLTLHQEYQAHLIQGGGGALKPSDIVLPVIGNKWVVIDAVASGDTSALLADLEALGLQKAAAYGRMVSGLLPIEAIGDLDALDSLNSVRPAYATTGVGLVDSQGDAAMNADDARATWGVDGTGATVGTLSDSYDCAPAPITDAATDVANGDLPAGIVVLDDTYCPGPAYRPASDEGRAMMQIIADVAPGANQAFHTAFNGQPDFAQGILDLAAAGAGIIVDDVGYSDEPFFQDGLVAQAVDTVVGMGVAYFSSAGNADRRSYEGPFRSSGGPIVDPDGDAHDFDPGPGVDEFQSVTIPEGATLKLSFQWDQPFFAVSGSPGSANDLDIYLVDDPPTTVLASSAGRNVGGDPLEIFNYTNPGPATAFNIVIEKYVTAGGPDPDLIKYVDFGGVIIVNEYATDSSTVVGHANADGAVAVGAAPYILTPEFGTDPAVLEPFSSAGGTPILFATDGTRLASPEYRSKPSIVAPDIANTTFFAPGIDPESDGFPNFPGTSAAAPHAAAVAALLLDASASLTPAEVYALLEDTAHDMDSPSVPGFPDGFDDDSGYGLVDADAALALLDEGPPGSTVFLPV
ncbi:MAG: S8 family serine peptidase, partial [Anaerolineae bacterium]